MAKAVWKYAFDKQQQVFSMPRGARILCVQLQRNTPCLWVLVTIEPDFPVEDRYFDIVGTGHQILDESRKYIGTFQVHNGDLVWHVFETTK